MSSHGEMSRLQATGHDLIDPKKVDQRSMKQPVVDDEPEAAEAGVR